MELALIYRKQIMTYSKKLFKLSPMAVLGWMLKEQLAGLNRQRIQRLYKKTYPGLKEGGTVSKEAGVLDTTEETKTGSTSSADTMTLDWIRRCSSDDPSIFPTVEEKVQFAEKLIEEEGKSVKYAAIVVGINRTTLGR